MKDWNKNEVKYLKSVFKEMLKEESLTDWERNYLKSIVRWTPRTFSSAQNYAMLRIIDKCKDIKRAELIRESFK